MMAEAMDAYRWSKKPVQSQGGFLYLVREIERLAPSDFYPVIVDPVGDEVVTDVETLSVVEKALLSAETNGEILALLDEETREVLLSLAGIVKGTRAIDPSELDAEGCPHA